MLPPFTAMGLGAVTGLGLWLIIDGVRCGPRPPSTGDNRLVAFARSRTPVHVAATLAAVAFVGWATGWPVGGILAGCAVWALPGIFAGADRRRQTRLARLEALATWTESLAATLGGAAGLEQTIITTAASVPQVIRPEVTALALALRRGARVESALRVFATDLADPVGDTIVAALILAATDGASRLAEPLSFLAAAAREEVAAQRRVERSRAKVTTDAQLIIATTLVMAVGLVVVNRGFLRPYETMTGQGVLAGVGALFAVGFRWLHQLACHHSTPRVLDLAHDNPQTEQTPQTQQTPQVDGGVWP